MISITLFIDGEAKQIPFPEEWNDLTQSELRYCVSSQAAEFSRPKIFCFLITTSALRNRIALPNGWESRLNKEEAAIAAVDCLAFLYDSNQLTKSPFKKIKINNVLLAGPDDDFKDLTVQQMELAHPALERFRSTMEIEHLHELCSYLFRRGKAPVSESSARQILPLIKKMQTDILLCMYTWFTGCMFTLPECFPDLYEGDGSTQNEFDYNGFTTMIHGAAGGRNGSREDIRRTKLLEFLFDLNLLAQDAKKQEKANAQTN